MIGCLSSKQRELLRDGRVTQALHWMMETGSRRVVLKINKGTPEQPEIVRVVLRRVFS